LALSIETVLRQPAARELLTASGSSFLQKEYSVVAVRDLYSAAALSIGI
jgi:hypothetical protein